MHALSHHLAEWIDTSSLPSLDSPRRMVVVGRTSVGKTTLVNALTGTDQPVGLGGVTRNPSEHLTPGRIWIDTPGIDGRDRALNELGPLVDRCHGVVWIVDGLQPVTRTEREVLELLLPPGLPLDVIISRADLVQDELTAIGERVGRQLEAFQPSSLRALNLRDSNAHDVLLHLRPTPTESALLQDALTDLRPTLARARPLTCQTLAETVTLRARVRTWLMQLEAREESVNKMLIRFAPDLRALADDAIISWAGDPQLAGPILTLPDLPPIPDPAQSSIDTYRMISAGRPGAMRELRSLAGSWVAEAELRLADWRDEQTFDTDALRVHSRLTQQLAELGELGHQHHQR